MKVICIKQYKQLAGILDVGDIVDITPVLREKTVVVVCGQTKHDERGRVVQLTPDIVHEKGSVSDWRFTTKGNLTYTGMGIYNIIGNGMISNLFDKI